MAFLPLRKPSDDSENIDYVPTLFAFKGWNVSEVQTKERRRRIDRGRQLAEAASLSAENQREVEEHDKESQVAAEGLLLLQQSCKVDAQRQISHPVQKTVGTQVLVCSTTPSIKSLPVESRGTRLYGRTLLEGKDECTKFYTGLTSWSIFKHLVTFLSTVCPNLTSIHSKLSSHDSLLLTLMQLRLNLCFEDLAYHFDIGSSTASDIFNKYIDLMYIHLKFLIKWPSQETFLANMPQLFKDIYPRTCCIIDYSEILIERPCSYRARAQTYSNYKKYNTVKFLIGITPCGAISYLSQCWGGRATDKCITMNSDFLRLLEYGDVVLADRDFYIADDIALHGATLVIPSFTRGKKQPSLQDVECSQKIAKIRIHVERVMGLLKNKYTILQGTLPVTFLKRKYDTDIAFIYKVLCVCSALVNLSPTIVPH